MGVVLNFPKSGNVPCILVENDRGDGWARAGVVPGDEAEKEVWLLI